MRNASCASIRWPRSSKFAACPPPMRKTSSGATSPATMPRRGSGNPNRASLAATTISQASTSPAPPATAGPLTAAISGLGNRSIVSSRSRYRSESSCHCAGVFALLRRVHLGQVHASAEGRARPGQHDGPHTPLEMQIAERLDQLAKRLRESAFRRSGRLMMIVPVCSCTLMRRSDISLSYSALYRAELSRSTSHAYSPVAKKHGTDEHLRNPTPDKPRRGMVRRWHGGWPVPGHRSIPRAFAQGQ